jgi:hypothetical protein
MRSGLGAATSGLRASRRRPPSVSVRAPSGASWRRRGSRMTRGPTAPGRPRSARLAGGDRLADGRRSSSSTSWITYAGMSTAWSRASTSSTSFGPTRLATRATANQPSDGIDASVMPTADSILGGGPRVPGRHIEHRQSEVHCDLRVERQLLRSTRVGEVGPRPPVPRRRGGEAVETGDDLFERAVVALASPDRRRATPRTAGRRRTHSRSTTGSRPSVPRRPGGRRPADRSAGRAADASPVRSPTCSGRTNSRHEQTRPVVTHPPLHEVTHYLQALSPAHAAGPARARGAGAGDSVCG